MISRLTLAVAASGSLLLAGCVDPNSPSANAQQGALIGAASGALLGRVTAADDRDNRTRNAVIGAAVGAAAGGIIGSRLDAQEAALRNSIGNDNVLIQNTGEQLIVTLPEAITFDVESASVRPSLQSSLSALARNLNDFPNTRVQVIGHTDNTGTASFNQQLSNRRANSVASVLINNGVAPARIVATGRGEDQPVATNQTPEGRQANRRVEIFITPI